MQAISDAQQLERLEKKVDGGFAEMRAEFKSVARRRGRICGRSAVKLGALQRVVMQMVGGMWLTLILGFVAIFFHHHI